MLLARAPRRAGSGSGQRESVRDARRGPACGGVRLGALGTGAPRFVEVPTSTSAAHLAPAHLALTATARAPHARRVVDCPSMDRTRSQAAPLRRRPRRGLDAAGVQIVAWGLRIVAAVFLVVFSAQVSGVAAFADEACCTSERTAASASGDEDCPPFCSDCLCCPHVRSTAPLELGVVAIERPRTSVLRFAPHALLRGEEHSRRVDHVPRASV